MYTFDKRIGMLGCTIFAQKGRTSEKNSSDMRPHLLYIKLV